MPVLIDINKVVYFFLCSPYTYLKFFLLFVSIFLRPYVLGVSLEGIIKLNLKLLFDIFFSLIGYDSTFISEILQTLGYSVNVCLFSKIPRRIGQ